MNNPHPQAVVSMPSRTNVVAFSPRSLSGECSSRALTRRDSAAAVVLHFDAQQDDETVLRRAAPWLQEDVDIIDEWRCCLFMSRFAKHVDASAGSSTVANIDWKIQRGTDVKGKIATAAGNVITMSGWGACFEGHRDAVLYAGLARANWLVTRPRGTPANKFEANVFDTVRKVKIHRNRERYIVSVNLTDEERAPVTYERFEGLAKAKGAVESAVKKLPNSRCDFQQRFAVLASMTADMLRHRAFMSEGGFSLDDTSRATILVQLDCLRQAIQQATVRFDRNERIADIESIAQKHGREALTLVNAVT
jgi:hypothetical protein